MLQFAKTVGVVSPLLALLALNSTRVLASDLSGTDDMGRRYENPFATSYERGPGWLRLGAHVGSMHGDGGGPRVWLVPWDYLQLCASYGYGSEHSFAGGAVVPWFPRASLTPYVTSGYALSIATIASGLSMRTHRVYGGLGLEARIQDRYYLGAEATFNAIWRITLKYPRDEFEVTPHDRYSIVSGIHAGVSLW
jgi:hypothetical protein